MQKYLGVLLVAMAAIYWFFFREPERPRVPHSRPVAKKVEQPKSEPEPEPLTEPEPTIVQASEPAEPTTVATRDEKNKKSTLPYQMKHGLMVVQGDTVVGVPTRPDAPDQGYVVVPPIKTWKGGTIPYHIQPDVVNPERVQQAIAMFAETNIRFVQQTGEENVLVFETGDEDCLSYVGQMGGKQPVWISPNCRAEDIAHEILHALGFVHEQNRADRDTYIDVINDNIDDRYAVNFEKLGPEFMKVSGLGEFDFNSLMIYPPWMFAKNGQSTMQPKQHDKLIQPANQLSRGDIERVNRAYPR